MVLLINGHSSYYKVKHVCGIYGEKIMKKGKKLTIREKEVLNGLGEGGTRRNVAKSLNIEKTTVDKHIEAIYEKYDVHEKSGAILFGLHFNDLDLNSLIKARLTKRKT